MFHKIKTLIQSIAQFFVEKSPADLTWRWVWDEESSQPIKHDSNPWLAYYASSPKRKSDRSSDPVNEAQSDLDWDSQKLIQFSRDKSKGFLPGINLR
jgi:hypothetical protein